MATVRYVNTDSSAGGDGTTNATAGATRAYATLEEAFTQEAASLSDVLQIYCSGTTSADTSAADITGFTTSAANYIQVIGNDGDFSSASYDTSKYRLEVSGNHCVYLSILAPHIRFENIQFQLTATSSEYACCYSDALSTSGSLAVFKNCIFKGVLSSTATGHGVQIAASVSQSAQRNWQLINCLFYDFVNSTNDCAGVKCDAVDTGGLLYNCTAHNCYEAYHLYNHEDYWDIRNTAANDCTSTNDCWELAGWGENGNGTHDYNCSDVASDAPNGSGNGQTGEITFADEANDDYTLSSSDTVCKENGVDLSAEAVSVYAGFSDDLLGATRSNWSIGCSEPSGPQTIDFTPPTGTSASNVPASAAGTGSATSSGYSPPDAPSASHDMAAAGTGNQNATYAIPTAIAASHDATTNLQFSNASAASSANDCTAAATGAASHQVTTAAAVAVSNQAAFQQLLSDNGIYGGFGYTGTDTLPIATLTAQAHNTEYTDPYCGGAITRIQAGNYAFGGPTTTRLHPEYSELQAFTYSQKFVILRGSGGGTTGSNDHGVQVIRVSDLTAQHSMSFGGHGYQVSQRIKCMYHPDHTDSFYAFTRTSSGAVSALNPWRITRYDLSLDGSDNVTSSGTEDLITFNGGTGPGEASYYIDVADTTNWEDCSWDGQYVALSAQKADLTWEIIVVDLINGVIDQTLNIPSVNCDPTQFLEWVQMSPSGNYVLVAFAPPATLPSWGQYAGIKCYNRSNGLYRCTISDNVGHSDCTWDRTTDIEWFIQDGASSDGGNGFVVASGHDIMAIDIANGIVWTTEFVTADITTSESNDYVRRLLNLDTTAALDFHSIHVSCTNYLYNRAQYAVVNTYGSGGEATQAFHHEVFKVYLTSTKASPVVKRLMQHRSDTDHIDYTGGSDYYSEPHATISPDGRWICLGSNFDVRSPVVQIDTYLIKDGWHRDLTPMSLNKFPLRVRALLEGGHAVANHNGWPAGGWNPVKRRFAVMAFNSGATGNADIGGGTKFYGNDEAVYDLETNRLMNYISTEPWPDPYVEKSPGSSRFATRHYDHGAGSHTYRDTDNLVYYFGSGSAGALHADLRGFDLTALTPGSKSTEEYYAAFYAGNTDFAAGDPKIKQAPAMVYNPDDDCLYCLSGKGVADDLTAYGGVDQLKAKVWKYSFSLGTWSDVTPTGMPFAYSGGAAWDSSRSKIWLFGGTSGLSTGSKSTYLYDPVAGTITLQAVTGNSVMVGRGWCALCYDAENDSLVLFGGANEDWSGGFFGASYTDVWVLDCTTLVWSELSFYPSDWADDYIYSQHLGYSPTEKCVYFLTNLANDGASGPGNGGAGGHMWAMRLSTPQSILEAFNANSSAVSNDLAATGTGTVTIGFTPAEATATSNDASATTDVLYTPPTATATANDFTAAAGSSAQIIDIENCECFGGSNDSSATGTGTATATYTAAEATTEASQTVAFISGTFVSNIDDVWTIPNGLNTWTIPRDT